MTRSNKFTLLPDFCRKIPFGLSISRSGTQWYVAIAIRVETDAPRTRVPDTFNGTGIDRGVADPCATAQGEMLGDIVETGRMLERESRLGRDLARCRPGSANRIKAKRRLANHKAKMARAPLERH